MSWITCAFCKGTGKDPFNLLSELALCQVCIGTGRVHIEDPPVECAFCKGTGVHPHTRISCTVCEGKGSVTHNKSSSEQCPKCKGKGHKVSENLPCSNCGGKGFVRKTAVKRNLCKGVCQND
jgi:DnaJ-class molecular chaperone